MQTFDDLGKILEPIDNGTCRDEKLPSKMSRKLINNDLVRKARANAPAGDETHQ